jgi:hypothetical protein
MTARKTLAAATALLALAAAPAAAAPATPDLAGMAVATSDLPRGAAVESEGYAPAAGTVAYYHRTFTFSRRATRRSGFAWLESDVTLLEDARAASRFFRDARQMLRDPDARHEIAQTVAAQLGLPARRVRVSRPRKLHIADGAIAMKVTVTVRHVKITVVLAFLRLDRVIAEVDSAGIGGKLMRRTRTVLRASAAHVRRGLSPVATSPPTVTGTAEVGSVLQAGPGVWSDATKPSSFAYRWERCDAAGANCVALPGATQPAYTVAAGDASSTLRVVVTAANHVGETTAASGPTAPIP